MERRFAVLAGDDTQALSHRRARRRTWLVVLALASVASPAAARPKRRDAKLAFDRGVAAYKKGSFEAAAEALARSFDLERDADTLFAWAQSERKLDRCDKAIDLYEKLLAFDLPQANKDAVTASLTECRAQVPAKVEPPPVTPPPVTPPPVTPPLSAKIESPPEPPGRVADREMPPPAPPSTDTQPVVRAWYKDPIALTLVGSGVAATGVGVGFLVSANSAHNDFISAKNYSDAQQSLDQARSRQTIGFIAAGAGTALVAGGVVWIFTHRDATEQHAVTGWLAPGGGGLAVAGGF